VVEESEYETDTDAEDEPAETATTGEKDATDTEKPEGAEGEKTGEASEAPVVEKKKKLRKKVPDAYAFID
jgi:hypothetical protein